MRTARTSIRVPIRIGAPIASRPLGGDPLTGVGVDERSMSDEFRPDELGLLRQPRMHVGGQPQRLLNVAASTA